MNTLDNELNNEFQISGREMFEFNPDLVGEDDDEATEGVIERERDSDDEVKGGGLNGYKNHSFKCV